MLAPDTQKHLTLRLRRIEGQVRGIERTITEPRLCVDLLTQIAAVQMALKSVGGAILHYHIRHCVPEAFSRRLRNTERERLEEMKKIFVQYCKQPVSSDGASQGRDNPGIKGGPLHPSPGPRLRKVAGKES